MELCGTVIILNRCVIRSVSYVAVCMVTILNRCTIRSLSCVAVWYGHHPKQMCDKVCVLCSRVVQPPLHSCAIWSTSCVAVPYRPCPTYVCHIIPILHSCA